MDHKGIILTLKIKISNLSKKYEFNYKRLNQRTFWSFGYYMDLVLDSLVQDGAGVLWRKKKSHNNGFGWYRKLF